ncbi:flavo-protein [Penicillium sp. IBT 16267x]|nr:flavo-protein [Penicillium sp. IBT 16267x]
MDSSASFSAIQYRDDKKFHVLLAATGSVATIKLPNIAEALCRHSSISLRIIVTQSAEKFLFGQSLEQPILDSLRQIKGVDAVYRDDDEWATPWTRGANILHIELRKVNIEYTLDDQKRANDQQVGTCVTDLSTISQYNGEDERGHRRQPPTVGGASLGYNWPCRSRF